MCSYVTARCLNYSKGKLNSLYWRSLIQKKNNSKKVNVLLKVSAALFALLMDPPKNILSSINAVNLHLKFIYSFIFNVSTDFSAKCHTLRRFPPAAASLKHQPLRSVYTSINSMALKSSRIFYTHLHFCFSLKQLFFYLTLEIQVNSVPAVSCISLPSAAPLN